jgi:hypothetical protein
MLTNPRAGTPCRIHYAKSYAHTMPLHGAVATVVLASRGAVRNHVVKLLCGWRVAVPAGNLLPFPAEPQTREGL